MEKKVTYVVVYIWFVQRKSREKVEKSLVAATRCEISKKVTRVF